MKTYRSTLRTMRLVILLCQLGLILRTDAQIPTACITSETNRPPKNSDINVECGTQYMDLSIYLCPVYQALYNESQMVLNHQASNAQCYGKADWNVTPPVLKFRFPINDSSLTSCNNIFTISDHVGSGDFAAISKVQYINISGIIGSIDPTLSVITYRPQIVYKFSCKYPMQYLINNTELGVSGVNLAIKDNNGSFITTLTMTLYSDEDHTEVLIIPQTGIGLKTKIYVVVKAINLTERFHVMLDRCYVTTSPYPEQSTFYDLFVGCTRDPQTTMGQNGEGQIAYFSFEAFRFVVHKNQTVSVFYLHCITRLCEAATCSKFLPKCDSPQIARRKRETDDEPAKATITSPPIIVGKQTDEEAQNSLASQGAPPESTYSSPVVALIVCIVVIAIFIVGLTIYFGMYIRQRKPNIS